MDTPIPYTLLSLPDNPPAILDGPDLKPRLQALAQKVEWYSDSPADEAEIIARAKDSEALISTRATVRFSRTVLAACPRLKIIARAGTGADHIDLEAAQDLGITVTNTPGYATPYVAEHALALALAVSRQLVANDRLIRQGGWTRGFVDELYDKTLGVVGTGTIGQRMIQLGKGIGMNVIAWTLHPTPERAARYRAEFVSLEELLRRADVVSLHVGLSSFTERLIGRKEVGLMKRTAVLVNTARAGVVDEVALTEALEQKMIAGAGLDVFEPEPLPPGHPFTRLDNVILSPHVGGITQNGVLRALEMAVESLESFAAGNPIYAVITGSRR